MTSSLVKRRLPRIHEALTERVFQLVSSEDCVGEHTVDEASHKTKIKIRLFGTFSVSGPDGRDLTPKSLKSQALIALLATSKNHCKRTRPWLQDKLWSAKSPEKSGTSLRQELRNIRKGLSEHAGVLQADRHVVWLDKDLFETDRDPGDHPDWPSFLEGMDIADLEFGNWLAEMRNQGTPFESPIPVCRSVARPLKRWKVVFVHSGGSSAAAQYLEAEFLGLLSRSLSEFGIAEVREGNCDLNDPLVFQVSTTATPIDETQYGFRASVLHSSSKRILWADTKTVPGPTVKTEANLPLITLTHLVQSAIVREISFSTEGIIGFDPPAFVLGKTTPHVFSFDAVQLDSIDKKLQEITEGPEHAIALGWRTQISVIRDIEQLGEQPDENAEKGRCLAARALEANSMNSLVLSSTANAHVFLDWDVETGAELARLAIRVNPSNPLAWWAYANVALYSEQTEKALKSAKIASQLAENSQLRFWCKFQLGLAALQYGDLELARRSLEASAAIAPRFRPPRRYLLALYAFQGEFERARKLANDLKSIEQSFSLEKFFMDDSYPVSLARKMRLLSPTLFLNVSDS